MPSTAERPPSSPAGSSTAASPLVLAIIRIALLLGVLLFGAATMFIQRRGAWSAASPESLEALRLAGIGIWVLAVIGVVALRLRGIGEAPRAGGADARIIGWAIGEAVALFGGVHYFLSGDVAWYINGVLFLVATFVIFPIPRARR